MSVVVFGSINMDLVARVSRLPSPGETLTGHAFQTFPGGKGANQAVACARLGAETKMVGRVGGDQFGEVLIERLKAENVEITHVGIDVDIPSGVAQITVNGEGENFIIVVPGANGRVGPADLQRLETALDEARVLLMQLEIPLDAVVAAARMAKQSGILVMLDPAPAMSLPDELYEHVDILTPNTTEAATLVGFAVDRVDDAAHAAEVLLDRGAAQVVVKMGEIGAFALGAEERRLHKAIPVEAVDTVAAGDAFNGALAVALTEDTSFQEAVHWGIAAGALAVTKAGAQSAMPNRESMLALLAEQGQ